MNECCKARGECNFKIIAVRKRRFQWFIDIGITTLVLEKILLFVTTQASEIPKIVKQLVPFALLCQYFSHLKGLVW